MQTPLWIIALAIAALLVLALVLWAFLIRRRVVKPLPTEWPLSARPVFSTEERRVYRQLREALPHHVVLSKLPLVRFCQPNDPQELRYWYELLGSIHVAFAICSANGRVLAAIDLDTDRAGSRRAADIKQAVLSACRVRYLSCPIEELPSIAELQLLVPSSGAARGPQPAAAHTVHPLHGTAASPLVMRRSGRATLWQDSTFFHDSFFAPDHRHDQANDSAAPVGAPSPVDDPGAAAPPAGGGDIAGAAVDPPRHASRTHK